MTKATLTLSVNGSVRQSGRVADMIWSVPEIIACLSRLVTLQPGDIIFTGTPAGVGPVEAGDVLEATLTGLPSLRVRLIDA
ncbi:Fumarylacetoacetate (FAA) hydrolase [Pararhodospirillum photometricum DSM 122]|uniref:Fumarylacetoacetate (FAA) hydrolase n=1 Tax=Pararhodospirillum photometricum DSM 122 TaxID=1150469 RepID=H6SS79_PARPM|nr:Fumarylacetoacetate (FAA) hydrolase [Pararhodospirillum photometricum DSM 122]